MIVKLKKTFNSKSLKKTALFSIPVLALIAVVLIIVFSSGNKTQAANTELEEKLADGGKLRVLEIVPDECQAQFAYLVKGQEPIADILYSDDVNVRKKITNYSDMEKFANIIFNEADSTWTNKNDFLGYVFNGYELNENGNYAIDEYGNYVEFKTETQTYWDSAAGANVTKTVYRYKKLNEWSYQPDDNGDYLKDYAGKYFQAKKDESGELIRYKVKEKIETEQIEFITMTPAQLDAKIAEDKDYLLTVDLLCVEKGSYGHLEKITNQYKYNGSHNENATYQTNDFKWATIEALYEYAGKLKKPIMFDSSLQGTSSTNLKRLYLMLRVMPYTTFKPVYDAIDHTTGDLNYKYTYNDMWNPGNKVTGTVTWDLSSFENYYLNTHGYTYSNRSEEYEVDENGDPLLDRYGNKIYKSYIVGDGARMDNLVDNVFLFKGEDISLGDRFKYILFGDSKNFTEVIDNLDEVATADRITNAAVLKYLLNLNSSTALRHKIQILEVEPSIDFKYAVLTDTTSVYQYERNDDEVRELLVSMGYLPTQKSIENVEVVTMYSAAFAGYKGDISDFEFIFIGDRQGNLAGDMVYRLLGVETPFNNTNNYGMAGFPDSNKNGTGTASYAGNDITSWMADNLADFVASKKVLMLAESIYTQNATKIDKNSVMYTLMDKMKGSKTVVNEANEGTGLVNAFARSAVTPELEFATGGYPVEYYVAGRTPEYVKLTPYSSKIDTNTGNKIDIFRYSFTFDIKGAPNKEYKAYVYLDINGDGRFVDYMSGTDETEEVLVSDIYTTNSSGYCKSNNISFDLPDNASGIVPWKLKIVEVGNEGNSKSQIGYTVCEPSSKKTIFVLQIKPNGNSEFDLANLNKAPSTEKEQQFQNYLSQASDYNVKIVSVTVNEFESWYNNSGTATYYKRSTDGSTLLTATLPAHPYDRDNPQAYDYLTDVFDMVIVGFGDNFGKTGFTNNGNSVYNLYDFVKAGHSMMLAHDVICYDLRYESSVENDKENYKAAYGSYNREFTKVFRDLAGQDRFGYMSQFVDDRKGIFDSEGYSLATSNGSGFTFSGVYSKDKLKFSSFTTPILTKFAQGTGVTFPWSGFTNDYKENMIVKRTIQLNRGAITEYPFHLGENISVNDTHMQFFQLNLEDENVTVWYTLAGKTYVTKDTSKPLVNTADIYNYTKNDAYNNYYVYTKDNITYTGAGHRDFKNITDDEMKLFVNTIISAIRIGNHAPTVTVTNASKSKTSDCNWVYYVAEDDTSCNINFVVQDIDLISGTPIRNTKVFWDKNGDGVCGTDDIVLDEYVGAIRNDKFDVNYNSVQIPPSDGMCTTFVREGSNVSSTKTTVDIDTSLADLIADNKNSYGESCIYITIQATDAKGASGTTIVKVKAIELYELD